MLYNDDPEEMLKVIWYFFVKLKSETRPEIVCFDFLDKCSINYDYWPQMICTVKRHIMSGGPRRLPFTIPALIFSALRVCIFHFSDDKLC